MDKQKALTVSIIVPVYNEERYLAACLDAIAKQTHKPTEVIVVDNNSTDRTVEIAKSYPFARVLSEANQGVAFARDRGFNAAHSDIIGRIDADTILPPGWVAQVAQMFEDPHMLAVSGPTGFYDLPFRRLSMNITKIIRTSLYYIGGKEDRYLYGSNMALRKDIWDTVANEVCHVNGIHEDNDLAIHLQKHHSFISYTNRLEAEVSVRRASAGPKEAWRYAFMEYATFRHHKMFSISALSAGIVLISFYPLLKLMHRWYDVSARRFSLKSLGRPSSNKRRLPMG